MKNSAM